MTITLSNYNTIWDILYQPRRYDVIKKEIEVLQCDLSQNTEHSDLKCAYKYSFTVKQRE
jgi:hypothetical protein